MNQRTVLTKLRELLAIETQWTKGEMARDYRGNRVSPYSQDAVCFCLLGGIDRVCMLTRVDPGSALRNTATCSSTSAPPIRCCGMPATLSPTSISAMSDLPALAWRASTTTDHTT